MLQSWAWDSSISEAKPTLQPTRSENPLFTIPVKPSKPQNLESAQCCSVRFVDDNMADRPK